VAGLPLRSYRSLFHPLIPAVGRNVGMLPCEGAWHRTAAQGAMLVVTDENNVDLNHMHVR
jgi:hypothetical protein